MTCSPACKQNMKKVDAKQFISWINQSVPESKRICEHNRTENSAKLTEKHDNADMCISLIDIPKSAVIICPTMQDNGESWKKAVTRSGTLSAII